MHSEGRLCNGGVFTLNKFDWSSVSSRAKRNIPIFVMNLVSSSSRLAVVLSCTAMFGAANAADKAAGQTSATPPPAPAAKPIDLPATVAVVNGDKISKADLQAKFDEAVKASGMDVSKLSDDQKLAGYHKLLDDMITEKLLQAKSADIKITDADVDAELEKIKKNFPSEDAFKNQLKQAGLDEAKLRAQMKGGLGETKWIQSQIEGKADVTPAEVEAFYKKNINEFTQPDQPAKVRASHILFLVPEGAPADVAKKKEAEAQAAYDRVMKGEDFAKVANELTEDPSGKGKGGDLDFFAQGQMVPEFDKAVFSMKVGDVSKPVKTSYGYHIIKVTDTKPAEKSKGPMPFDQVKDQLTGYLKNQKQQVAVHDVIEKLHSEAKIQNNLPEMKPAPVSPTEGADAGAPPAPEPQGTN